MAKTLNPLVVWNLLKELRVAAEDMRPLVLSGPLAEQLQKELTRGGGAAAVRVGGPLEAAAVLVRILAGAPTDEDATALKAAKRARVPVLAVQTGTEAFDVPYVLATDVVGCRPGEGFPVDEIAAAVAARLGAAHGVDVDQQRVPEVLATVAAGFGFRAVARQLLGAVPVAGWLVKGGIAYAGTRALGEAAQRYFQAVAAEGTPA